jgi:4-amino-4-deoxy-L-arabinose transferase-like glycosyltransferase
MTRRHPSQNSRVKGHRSLLVIIPAGLAIFASSGLKIWLIFSGRIPFNADEAIVALMARHIQQGRWPLFFYGQAYMGSLDPILIAPFFGIFGEAVWVVRVVQMFLFIAILATTFFISKQVFGGDKAGISSIWLLAIPAVTLTLYTTASIGDYGEMLLLGNIIILCAFRIGEGLSGRLRNRLVLWFTFGFLSGFGVWVFGLSVVYSLPAAIYLFVLLTQSLRRGTEGWKEIAQIGSASAVGVLAGLLPVWIYASQNGVVAVFGELGGSAIEGVEQLGWGGQVFQHLLNIAVFGGTASLAIRPSWEVRWLALPLLPLALFFWMGVGLFVVKKIRVEWEGRDKLLLLLSIPLTLAVGFIFTPFGADPSGRYFLPIMVILSILAGGLIKSLLDRFGYAAWALLALVIAFNFWGTIESALRYPPGLTTQFDQVTQIDHSYDQALMDFLKSEGVTRGYSNYWVSYPLAFLSSETLIFIPRLPYHQDLRFTDRDDRYRLYDQLVNSSDQVAYITTKNPLLDRKIRQGLKQFDVSWDERQIGDYQIYYHLSKPVRPDALGLGITNP